MQHPRIEIDMPKLVTGAIARLSKAEQTVKPFLGDQVLGGRIDFTGGWGVYSKVFIEFSNHQQGIVPFSRFKSAKRIKRCLFHFPTSRFLET